MSLISYVYLDNAKQLKSTLSELDGERTILLTTTTEPTWSTVKNNPWVGRVKKIVAMRARVNADYAAEVNRDLEAKGLPGDYVPGPRPWGKRIGHSPLIEHKGQLYLEVVIDQVGGIAYTVDGRNVTKESLQPFEKATTERAGVVIRTYKLESIDFPVLMVVKPAPDATND